MGRRLLSINIVAVAAFSSGCNKQSAQISAQPEKPNSTISTPAKQTDVAVPTHPFKDDWGNSGSLSEFRNQIRSELESGNQDQVLQRISNSLQLTDGSDRGAPGIIEHWGLDGSKEKFAPLKELLESLVSNGGCLYGDGEDSTFEAPSYNCFSPSQMEACGESKCGIVTASDQHLYSSPDPSSLKIAALQPNEVVFYSNDTLCDAQFNNCTWRKITRHTGHMGFIQKDKLKAEIDGFLKLIKEGSEWKIMVLRIPGVPVEGEFEE